MLSLPEVSINCHNKRMKVMNLTFSPSTITDGLWWVQMSYNMFRRTLLRIVENSKYNNFSGLPCARLTRNQSVRGEGQKEPSSLFLFVSFLCFKYPAKHLQFFLA